MRRVGGAAAAAALLLVLTGCGSQVTAPTITPTVTVAPTPSSTPSSSASASASSSAPTASASSTPASSGASAAGDPGRPADQCADQDLGVTITRDNGGGGAGSEVYDVLFTNTGGGSCVLRGAPGVSVVGGGNGTQLGEPAARNQADAVDVRLAPGQAAGAPLQVVDIRDGGGPLGSACRVRKGDGFRVYPPHSKKAIFVKSDDAYACTSSEVFMTVRTVVRFTD
ncbi:DUF4232 domain-containing protein [Amnibacterium endophyticum]|uniref:DUF4232 domain-containing protein n=1 Tax=Amnibacterium endophyticum TaxID=2109337 RepID=A0ABW4LCU4_9MICO